VLNYSQLYLLILLLLA